ncbi:hypothetical protein TNCV_1315631 [Trichonephila clavipes]|uniref:Uncharacterized protein n=1 Tax=Trichonephila clavipes TaxID=2585209 RepID=A0A8X6VIY0_TRICX|nr:hypothetical protein TNCV_1315631 [Trichonephila clavipes]
MLFPVVFSEKLRISDDLSTGCMCWPSFMYRPRPITIHRRYFFSEKAAVGMAVGSVVVRASDSRPEGLGSMPNATKYPPSTHTEYTLGVRAR